MDDVEDAYTYEGIKKYIEQLKKKGGVVVTDNLSVFDEVDSQHTVEIPPKSTAQIQNPHRKRQRSSGKSQNFTKKVKVNNAAVENNKHESDTKPSQSKKSDIKNNSAEKFTHTENIPFVKKDIPSRSDKHKNSKKRLRSRSSTADNTVETPQENDTPENIQSDADSWERQQRTVFVGNVPMGTNRKKLRVALKLDKEHVENIYYRSIIVDKQFTKARKIGIIKKSFPDTATKHNAYIVLKSKELVEKVLQQNKTELNGTLLQINRADRPKKFSKFNVWRTIFVGNLHRGATEDDLFQTFSKIGVVTAWRIIRDKVSGISKGFAFVCFESTNSVKIALATKSRIKIKQRPLRITRAMRQKDAALAKKVRKRKLAKVRTQKYL